MAGGMVLEAVSGVNSTSFRLVQRTGAMYRYALYYAPPPGTALAAFGARWLGRDPDGAEAPASPELARVTPGEWRRAVALPRRYGFHATLKAPFSLAEGRNERSLLDALEDFCRARGPAPVGKLALRVLSDFLVLAPMEAGEPEPVAELAFECVRAFDSYRAPLTAAEIARRRPERLSAPQQAKLERWGYPYVEAEYRFHLTLTDRLDKGGRAKFGGEIARMVLPAVAEPIVIEELCLFGQAAPGADFRVLGRFGFGGANLG